MLDLDEMKAKWIEQDQKLDEIVRINRQLLAAPRLSASRTALQRLVAWLSLGATIWIIGLIGLGSFANEHIDAPRLWLPAGALALFSIGMAIGTIRQLVAARQIDYAKPIATIQRQLEQLRILRIRTTQFALIGGTIVWAPLAIVLLNILFGLKDYSAPWLWANILFGLSLIPLAVWLSWRFGEQINRSPFVRQLMNDIAGRNLRSATAFLANLSEFEGETSR